MTGILPQIRTQIDLKQSPMADNDLDTRQKLENFALRTHIFANAVPKSAGVAFLSVHFRVNPGDTLDWQ